MKRDAVGELFEDVDPAAATPLRFRGETKVPAAVARFKALPCFPEFSAKLNNGESAAEIARWLQRDKGLFADMAESSLVGAISRYKSERPLTDRKDIPASATPAFRALIERGKATLDEVDAVHDLYRLQAARIQSLVQAEQKEQKQNPQLAQEFRVAGELLALSTKIKETTGFFAPVAPEPDQPAQPLRVRTVRPEVEAVLSDPESRRKILSVAETLLRTTGKHKDLVPLLRSLRTTQAAQDAAVVATVPPANADER